MNEKDDKEKVKHTVTVEVSRQTWELLEWICRFDGRAPRQQISYFLNILSGETVPSDTLSLELYKPLYGLLKQFKESDHWEARRKLNAIIRKVALGNHALN